MKDLSKLIDEKVVEIVRNNDNEIYAEIVKRYQEKLLRYASYLVKDEEKAADVVQSTLIKAYVNLNSFNTSKKFSSWIYRITHNEAMNIVKKYKKEVVMQDGFDGESEIDIEKEYDKKELKQMVRKCLDGIPLKYKESLSLYYLEEKSYKEISDILRIPIGTIGTRINRGKLLMRKICQKRKVR
jgi:RNA polymerase sigma-70 factor, ECF subfamily